MFRVTWSPEFCLQSAFRITDPFAVLGRIYYCLYYLYGRKVITYPIIEVLSKSLEQQFPPTKAWLIETITLATIAVPLKIHIDDVKWLSFSFPSPDANLKIKVNYFIVRRRGIKQLSRRKNTQKQSQASKMRRWGTVRRKTICLCFCFD